MLLMCEMGWKSRSTHVHVWLVPGAEFERQESKGQFIYPGLQVGHPK